MSCQSGERFVGRFNDNDEINSVPLDDCDATTSFPVEFRTTKNPVGVVVVVVSDGDVHTRLFCGKIQSCSNTQGFIRCTLLGSCRRFLDFTLSSKE